jgi:hypothetical protein
VTSGLLWASLIFSFPETSRCIVDDGSIAPHGIYRTLFTVLEGVRSKRETQESIGGGIKFKWRRPNPLRSLKLLWSKDTAAIVVTGSIFYTIFGNLGASLSVQGIRIYHLDYLQAGKYALLFLRVALNSLRIDLYPMRSRRYDFRILHKYLFHRHHSFAFCLCHRETAQPRLSSNCE